MFHKTHKTHFGFKNGVLIGENFLGEKRKFEICVWNWCLIGDGLRQLNYVSCLLVSNFLFSYEPIIIVFDQSLFSWFYLCQKREQGEASDEVKNPTKLLKAVGEAGKGFVRST